MLNSSVYNAAKDYVASGLSVIPVKPDGSKAPPISWKPFQTQRASDAELGQWFENEEGKGIGIICGQISGKLEILDIDAPELYEPFCALVEEVCPALLDKLLLVMTPDNGYHFYYRCNVIEGNQKLAEKLVKHDDNGKPKYDTLFETRGEGGYVIAPASPATCHPSNKPYKLLRGEFTNLPEITSEERDIILTFARSFNEKVIQHEEEQRKEQNKSDVKRPGDDFNAKFDLSDWNNLLTKHGWKKKMGTGRAEYWAKPDKTGRGISATLNHRASNLFYVFSTSASPFEAEQAYTPFAAYTFLEHNGDFNAAAKALFEKGYGENSIAAGNKNSTDSDNVTKTQKLIKKDELVKLAENVDLFCELDGNGTKAFATVPVATHFETYRIDSQEFRLWLTNEFYRVTNEAVSSQPMQDALNTLTAKAYFEGKKHQVFIRIGELNGKFYYDLGDEKWSVVEIDSEGWRIVEKPPVKFIRPSGYKSQIIPVRGGNVSELRKFVNVQSDDDWTLFLGWLVSCFRPSGPYAILSLSGTQDAAKSTTTKMIRLLVDPSTALVRAQPKEERDLMVGAKNNWLLAFDNLSHISETLSDALCRVSTGGGQANREHYTNADEYLFDVMRPVVMNGIEELATRADLVDRTINVFLPSLKDEQRKDEKVLYSEYMQALPRILGAVLDILAVGIKNLPNTHLEKLPRMADVAKFVTAAEPALGWESGTFLNAYESYRSTARINTLDASHVGTAILSLMNEMPHWQGTATELISKLDKCLPLLTSRKNFPTSARGMSGALRRLVPNLKEVGIDVDLPEGARRSTTGKVARTITLTYTTWINENSQTKDGNLFSF